MREVVVAGCGMTTFGKHSPEDLGVLARQATAGALKDAQLDADAVGYVTFSNVMGATATGQNSIRGEAYLRGSGLDGLPMVNVENACASGGTAFHLAWQAVAGGYTDVAVAVGAEVMKIEDRAGLAKTMLSGVDLLELDEIRAMVGSTSDGAFFMDVYAHGAREYLKSTNATAADLAAVAVKNRAHGYYNERAQFRERVTLEQVLASRVVSAPLTLMMCSPLSDGASAIVLTTPEIAERSGANAVSVAASVLTTGVSHGDNSGVRRAANAAYEQASLGPTEIDLVELHDATASAELIAYEQLRLCEDGEASALLASGATTLGGRIPVNTSGGLLTKGHPVGATGCAQIYEIVNQLRGHAGLRQVSEARHGLAMNAGGFMPTADVAACSITILSH